MKWMTAAGCRWGMQALVLVGLCICCAPGAELVENPTLRSLAVNRWVPVHELFSNPRGLGIFAPALGIGPAGRVAGYAPCFSSATA